MSGRRGNARGTGSRRPGSRGGINFVRRGGVAPHAARGRRGGMAGSGVPTTQRPVLFTRAAMMTFMHSMASAARTVADQLGRRRFTATELLEALGVGPNFSLSGPTAAGGRGLVVTHGFEAVLTMDTRNTPGGRQPGIRLLDVSEGRPAPADRHLVNMDDVTGTGPIALQGHGGTFHVHPIDEMDDNDMQAHVIPTILVGSSVDELGVYEEDSDDSSSETDMPASRYFDIEE